MSSADLPDNPQDWPGDPFAVLGVSRGVSEREIKRAYTKLIRRFKPEHSPEQFRRVREAYETCLQQWHWFFTSDEREEPEPSVVVEPPPPPQKKSHSTVIDPPVRQAEDTPDEKDVDQPHSHSPVIDPPVRQSEGEPAEIDPPLPPPNRTAPDEVVTVIDRPVGRPVTFGSEVDRLWAEAIAGRHQEAYTGLEWLSRDQPDQPDIALRLYWLLSLNEDLDSVLTRHHWLAEALRRSHLSGAAAELYRRELEVSPWAGLSSKYLEITAGPAAIDELLTLCRWRVVAAARSGRWEVVGRDLRAVRTRALDNETAWLGLLAMIMGWAVWSRPEDVYDYCRAELAQLRHLELSQSHHFDRVEEGNRLAAAFRSTHNLPDALAHLVRNSWAGYGNARPADIAAAAALVAADPTYYVSLFDKIGRAGGTAVIALLAQVLGRAREERDGYDRPEFPAEYIRGMMRRVGTDERLRDYWQLRSRLIDFALDEAIDPIEIASACTVDPDFRFRNLATQVGEDLSLRTVWLAASLHRW